MYERLELTEDKFLRIPPEMIPQLMGALTYGLVEYKDHEAEYAQMPPVVREVMDDFMRAAEEIIDIMRPKQQSVPAKPNWNFDKANADLPAPPEV